jgi:uncharacterized surface protein with fasciclin (FAS1) repeats
MLVCLVVVLMATVTVAFQSTTSKFSMVTHLTMGGGKDGALANTSRKLKRSIRSVTDAASFTALLTPETEDFLKNKAQAATYDQIMKNLSRTARSLKVEMKADFAARPKETRINIVETATAAGTFNTLLAACTAAGLVETLKGGFLTVFAPSDAAFAALPEGTVEGLLADKERLTEVLMHHVIGSSNSISKMAIMPDITTLHGTKLKIKTGKNGDFAIDGTPVVARNLKCSNGIVHVIDTVLMPPVTVKKVAEEPAAPAPE